MGVKFSQLTSIDLDTIWTRGQIAILDTSSGMVNKMNFTHASEYRSPAGGGTDELYGHVKLSDEYEDYHGFANSSLGASQAAVHNVYRTLSESLGWYKKTFVGLKASWDGFPYNTKLQYDVVILTDV